jgi:hypothetical protein
MRSDGLGILQEYALALLVLENPVPPSDWDVENENLSSQMVDQKDLAVGTASTPIVERPGIVLVHECLLVVADVEVVKAPAEPCPEVEVLELQLPGEMVEAPEHERAPMILPQ